MSNHDSKGGDSETSASPFAAAHLDGELNAEERTVMSDEAGREWLRLSAALRRAVRSTVELDTSVESLRALAEDAERFADTIEVQATGRRVPLFGSQGIPDQDDLGALMPFSPVLGKLNPISPGIKFRHEQDQVVGRVTFCSSYQGAPGLVHGAVISSIYDELLAMANLMKGVPGPTAKLTIRYRKPTPLHTPLRFEAWVEEARGRRIHTRGRCLDGDRVLTEAEGVFVRIDGLKG